MRPGHTPVPRYRPTDMPAIFAQGFRPFFLLAALWAVMALALWLAAFAGMIHLPTAFDPIAWHAHEMLFGYAGAVLAGFLLTAVPNWTGRLPLAGAPLAVLAGLWIIGRLALIFGGPLGPAAVAALDLLFPVTLIAVILREILAGRNWRNLPVVAALAVLIAANLLAHLGAAGALADPSLGNRLALAVFAMLITLIGGRIVPSFTRNWLVKRGAAALPAPFGAFDKAVLAVTLIALALYAAGIGTVWTAAVALAAALLNVMRLARWRPHRTGAEPLVTILHLGYLWVPIGLALIGAAALDARIPGSAAAHALGTGAVGTMTLAVMTRASLGHTGRALSAGPGTWAIYAAILAAGAARTLAALLPDLYLPLLHVSGTAWLLAFALFALIYGRLLTTVRS